MAAYRSANVWRTLMEVFDLLPIAAIVDSQYFCVHGGLSPDADGVDQIRQIDRKQEIPATGILCDLTNADPTEEGNGWTISPRGASYLFGPDVTQKWNHSNKLEMLVRSHTFETQGFSVMHDKKVVTLCSAPKYCGMGDNAGGVMRITGNSYHIATVKVTSDTNKKSYDWQKEIDDYLKIIT